nr:putative uncharacterized protein C5orf66 homolog isoform X3 [Macaca nemestrina]
MHLRFLSYRMEVLPSPSAGVSGLHGQNLRSSIHLSLWVCWCPRHWASPPISAGVLHMRHLLPGGGVSRGVRKLQPKKETLLWDCGCSGLRRLPGRNGRTSAGLAQSDSTTIMGDVCAERHTHD